MAMITETIELLGKGMYNGLPDTITLSSIPTISELDYIGTEDFDKIMIEKIFPIAINEKFDWWQLFEHDYYWICRCLRFLNYGPYYTTNVIYCASCGKTSHGEYQVSLQTIPCTPYPDNFKNELTISKDEFIDYDKDVKVKLLTIKEITNAQKDPGFLKPDGTQNVSLARLCYSIKSFGSNGAGVTPIEARMALNKDFSAADYKILEDVISDLTDYGLRVGGKAQCPACGSKEGQFLALSDDRFFRPTLGDLRKWRDDKRTGEAKDSTGNTATTV